MNNNNGFHSDGTQERRGESGSSLRKLISVDGDPQVAKRCLKRVISFDIDGTLETGHGPGPITLDMVRQAKECGYIIGSCSDRPVGDQRNMWAKSGIEVEFTVLKHMLDAVRSKFEADVYYHIGDTDLDQFYAGQAGFEFLQVQNMAPEPWMMAPDGQVHWGPEGRGPVDPNNLPHQPTRYNTDDWSGEHIQHL